MGFVRQEQIEDGLVKLERNRSKRPSRKPLVNDKQVNAEKHNLPNAVDVRIAQATGLYLRVGEVRKDGSNAKRWFFRYSKVVYGVQERSRIKLGRTHK